MEELEILVFARILATVDLSHPMCVVFGIAEESTVP
jgi:hypothetical protein